MITGKALTPVQDSALLYYQATEGTKKLLIMKTKAKLSGVDTSTLIKPIVEIKSPVMKTKRNPTDFGQPRIPPQTSCKENGNDPVIYEHTLKKQY